MQQEANVLNNQSILGTNNQYKTYTCEQLIQDALSQCVLLVSQGDNSQAVEPSMNSAAFIFLNDIILSWSMTAQDIPFYSYFSFQFNPGQGQYTFGLKEGMDFNISKFVQIDTVRLNVSIPGQTFPIYIPIFPISETERLQIPVPTVQAYPQNYLFRNYNDFCWMEFILAPATAYTVNIYGKQQLQPYTDIHQDLLVQFPWNVILPLKYRLINDLMVAYRLDPPPMYLEMSNAALKKMRNQNTIDMQLMLKENISSNDNSLNAYFLQLAGLA